MSTSITKCRKTLLKWSMQVRTSSLQDIEGHDDGFSWRKYGQKEILGCQHPRRYYRCKHRITEGCQAVKHLQATDGDPLLFDVLYAVNHTCAQGAKSLPQPGHEQSSISLGVKAKGSVQGLEKKPPRLPKGSTQVRVRSLQDGLLAGDGSSWRKYGQRDILGSLYPRLYYRCTYKHDEGRLATKHVQRSDGDPQFFDIVYYGEHTCAESKRSVSAQSPDNYISFSKGLMPQATSDSLVTFEAVSSSSTAAGSQVTHEEASRSMAGFGSMSREVVHTIDAPDGGEMDFEALNDLLSADFVGYTGNSDS